MAGLADGRIRGWRWRWTASILSWMFAEVGGVDRHPLQDLILDRGRQRPPHVGKGTEEMKQPRQGPWEESQ